MSIIKTLAELFVDVFAWACEAYGRARALLCAEVQNARRQYVEACAE